MKKTFSILFLMLILNAIAARLSQAAMANNQHRINMPKATVEIPTLTEKDKARFCSKIAIGEIEQCWEWHGAKNKTGYGYLKVGGKSGKNFMAHRLSLNIFNKERPGQLCVLHRCDNPPCVNPSHLFLGTVFDNNSDRHSKGRSGGATGAANGSHLYPERMVRGVNHPRAKLNNDSVINIRNQYASGLGTLQSIADSFSVSKKTILNIIKGRIWKHV